MTDISAKYEQLIQDLRRDYRPQREWGQGRGLFLVVGHFLVGIAAGAWLFGLLFHYQPGLIAGFLLAGIGGIAHLAFLGRPERFWKMARHVRTAWIARGFIGLAVFLVGAALYLPAVAFAAWPWGAASGIAWFGWLMAAFGMIVLIVYMGFVYSASKGIPFWNSPLHPLIYIGYALRGGAAAVMTEMAVLGAPGGPAVKQLVMIWIAVTALVVLLFALDLRHALGGGDRAARASVRELLSGGLAKSFYGGTLLLGLVVPMLVITSGFAGLELGVLAIVGISSAVGDFFAKYTTIRAGIYRPLKVPHTFGAQS